MLDGLRHWMVGIMASGRTRCAYRFVISKSDSISVSDSVLAVHHRIRRGALLGEMHDCVRGEVPDNVVCEIRVGKVADVAADHPAGQVPPDPDPRLQRLDRNQAVHAHLEVIRPAREVVRDGDVVAGPGQVECRWPP